MDYSLAKNMGHCGSLWVIVGRCGSLYFEKINVHGRSFLYFTFLAHCGSLWDQLAELYLSIMSVLDSGLIVGHCGSSRVLQIPSEKCILKRWRKYQAVAESSPSNK